MTSYSHITSAGAPASSSTPAKKHILIPPYKKPPSQTYHLIHDLYFTHHERRCTHILIHTSYLPTPSFTVHLLCRFLLLLEAPLSP
jgi:hypothetical protein